MTELAGYLQVSRVVVNIWRGPARAAVTVSVKAKTMWLGMELSLPRGNLVFTLVALRNSGLVGRRASPACMWHTCPRSQTTSTVQLYKDRIPRACKHEEAACASACGCFGERPRSHRAPQRTAIGCADGNLDASAERVSPPSTIPTASTAARACKCTPPVELKLHRRRAPV